MTLPTDKVLAVIPAEECSPTAFLNVYEPGDVWLKVQGCEACDPERAKKCCGNCPHRVTRGCDWHEEPGVYKGKPLHCVILPVPSECKGGCALVYECLTGSHEGKRRHVTDRGGILR